MTPYISTHISSKHFTFVMFKPELQIFYLKPASPIGSPSIMGKFLWPKPLKPSLFLSFFLTPHMMQILLAQPSKDTPNQIDFTIANIISLLPAIIFPFLDYALELVSWV